MSGGSRDSVNVCPNCANDSLVVYEDNKPFETLEIECTECGFTTFTKVYYKDLSELNEYRKVNVDESLTELPKQTFMNEKGGA
jgi:Zn ribbon nucleic-acid-binding protein